MTTLVGQSVLYSLSETDVAELEHAGATIGPRGPLETGMLLPALITRAYGVQVVNEDGAPTGETRTAVNLQVLLDGQGSIWRQDVPEAAGHGGWQPGPGVDLTAFYGQAIQPALAAMATRVDGLAQQLAAATTPQGAHASDSATPPAASSGVEQPVSPAVA